MLATPAFSTASTIAFDSAAVRPSGFSHMTILPAFAAAIAISAWVSFGLAISIRSTEGSSTRRRQSFTDDSNPHLAANPWARSGFRAQTVFSTGVKGRSKKLGTLRNAFECVRPMKPQPTRPTFNVFMSVPAVGVADCNHDAEHIGPSLRIHHLR